MTKEEKDIVLRECDEKEKEITLKKEAAEKLWESNYNKNYKFRFAVSDAFDKVLTSKVSTGVLIVAGAGIYALSHSWALTVGVPVGAGILVNAGNVSLMVANVKKTMEYQTALRSHEQMKKDLEREYYPYKIISDYLRTGKKYLLHRYRQNLERYEWEDIDELDYLDVDTAPLSPLMIKALAEMKEETKKLSEEMKSSLIENINAMHTSIMDSGMSIYLLEEYQKVLKKYAPIEESTTLTS